MMRMDDDCVELLVLGAQKILRICCARTPAAGRPCDTAFSIEELQ